MSIAFTAPQRLTITGRQLTILVENAGYQSSITNLTAQQAKLLSVDEGNAVYYSQYTGQAAKYENERQNLDGSVATTYTDGTISPYTAGDLSTSAMSPGSAGATFFPSTPTSYTESVPYETAAINGTLSAPGTNPNNETTALVNITTNRNFLLNGITGASSASTTTTGSLAPGGTSLSVTSSSNFTAGDYIYVSSGSSAGIYQVVSASLDILTISSVLPSASTLPIGSNVTNTASGYTNSQRNSLSGPYQEIFTNLTNAIITNITTWQTALSVQITALNGNTDTNTNNTNALTADNSAATTVATWIALPNTGSTGSDSKFVDANFGSSSALYAEMGTRQTFITTRIPQIVTSLGSVAVSGNDFTGTGVYLNRYTWLNNRINRVSGSATRYFAAGAGISMLQQLLNSNLSLLAQYNTSFTTKALTANDSTTIIQVANITGLSQGDVITVVSNTQPELQRAIMQIQGTTQLVLDSGIPNTYLVSDAVRVFKTL